MGGHFKDDTHGRRTIAIVEGEFQQLGHAFGVFPLIDPVPLLGIPETPTHRGDIGEDGQPIATLFICLEKGIVSARSEDHATAISISGGKVFAAHGDIEKRRGVIDVGKRRVAGRVDLRSQADDGLAGAEIFLAESKRGRGVGDCHLVGLGAVFLGRRHLESGTGGQGFHGLTHQAEKPRDLFIALVVVADLFGGIGRFPDDSKKSAREQGEDRHGNHDLEKREAAIRFLKTTMMTRGRRSHRPFSSG